MSDQLADLGSLSWLEQELFEFEIDAEFWDVRVEDSIETLIQITDGEVVVCSVRPSCGAFLRVRKNGFWNLMTTTDLTTIKSSLRALSHSQRSNPKAQPYEAEKHKKYLSTTVPEKRYSQVPLEKKLTLTKSYSDVLEAVKEIASSAIHYQDIFKIKSYINSSGTLFEYDFNQGGMHCGFTLKDKNELFEDVLRMYGTLFEDLEGRHENLKDYIVESKRFLKAPAIVPGKYKVILDPEVSGVFTHESFGHKSEADFILGNQETLNEWMIGKKIASELLSIVDCGMAEGTSGNCPIDDEGEPARKNDLIRNGVLQGRLHTRETAKALGERPTGNARAINFEHEPIVRMTSTYIEPGQDAIENILARSEGAIWIEGFKHGSGLSTFTIAPLRGYRVGPNGTRDPVRVTVISGSVFETLKNIEAVSKEFRLYSGAIGGCGKFNQSNLPVAFGGPYLAISEMQVS